MEHTQHNPNQYLPKWARTPEATQARKVELEKLKSDLHQLVLGELTTHVGIDGYDYQLNGKLAFEIDRLTDVVVRFYNPHLDIKEGETEAVRLGRFYLDKTEKREQISEYYGVDASTVLCELYNVFLPDNELVPASVKFAEAA